MKEFKKGKKGLIVSVLHRKFPKHYNLEQLYEMILDLDVVDYLVKEPFEDKKSLDEYADDVEESYRKQSGYNEELMTAYRKHLEIKGVITKELEKNPNFTHLEFDFDQKSQDKIRKV